MVYVATKWRFIRLFKAPFSAFYCGVPAAAFIQTFFLGYPIKTTFLALRRSNRAKPLWKMCVPFHVAEFCVWVTVVPTTASFLAGGFIDSEPSTFKSVCTTDVTSGGWAVY